MVWNIQPPQTFCLHQTLADCAVRDPALPETVLEKRHGGFEVFLTTLLKFNQCVKVRGRLKRSGDFFRDDVLQRLLRKELKAVRESLFQCLQTGTVWAASSTPRISTAVLRWRSRHGQFHNNAKRSLGADKQVAEIITVAFWSP